LLYEDVVREIIDWLGDRVRLLLEAGYRREDNLILDPGIGFGKQPEHNIEILRRFEEFRALGRPLLVGVSRKSFVEISRRLLRRDSSVVLEP